MYDQNSGDSLRRSNDLTSGRKFNADELELMLLRFVGDAPAHGYELIKRISDVSGGYYSPSPGVLYPALARLEANGFTHSELKGRRKHYCLTPDGKAHSNANAQRIQQLFAILKHAAKKMVWMNHARDSMDAAADATGWLPEFIEARQALQAALLKYSDADHKQQRRVVSIVQRATAEILNDTSGTTESKRSGTTQPEP